MKKIINTLAITLLIFYGIATFLGALVEHMNNLSIENFINNIILPAASNPVTLIFSIIIGLLHRFYLKGKKAIGIVLITYCGLILFSLVFGTWFAKAVSGY